MRIKIFYKFGFFTVLILLLSLTPVRSISVGQPLPPFIKLLRNDVGRFFFRISADSSSDLICTYSVSGLEPLDITFDEEQVIIKSGIESSVYGSISVPADAPIKTYNGNLEVSCEPIIKEKISGSMIKQSMTTVFELSVVESLEERVAPSIPEKEKPTSAIPTSVVFTIIIIVIPVIGVGYWFIKRGKKKK